MEKAPQRFSPRARGKSAALPAPCELERRLQTVPLEENVCVCEATSLWTFVTEAEGNSDNLYLSLTLKQSVLESTLGAHMLLGDPLSWSEKNC